jgi:PASTA domain
MGESRCTLSITPNDSQPIEEFERHSQVMRAPTKILTSWALVALAFAGALSVPSAAASSAPIGIRITLDRTSAGAGQAINGSVLLTNTTNRAILIKACTADSWLVVGLTGRVSSLPFSSLLLTCRASQRLRPGPNRFGVRVITTYAQCAEPQPDGRSAPTRLSPWCTTAGLPPLPPGRYVTKLRLVGLTGLTQTPNQVVVHLRKLKNPPPTARCADQSGTLVPVVTVPDVVGMSPLAAAVGLATACLNTLYASSPGNRVVSESPSAGSKVPEHSNVTLTNG